MFGKLLKAGGEALLVGSLSRPDTMLFTLIGRGIYSITSLSAEGKEIARNAATIEALTVYCAGLPSVPDFVHDW